MKKILILALGCVALMAGRCHAASDRPTLVVGIVVDQLRTDYVEYLRPLFVESGFKLLADSGVYMRDVDFVIRPADAAAASAMLYTGAYPSANGVPGAVKFDPAKLSLSDVLSGSDGLSAEALRLSTLADELAIDGSGLGLIYSVGTDAVQSVVMSGHAGNGAFWTDPNSGRWSSTSYYPAAPQAIQLRNTQRGLSSRIDTMQWKPLLKLEEYPGLPAQKKYYPFRHTFPRSDRNVYKLWAQTPLANAEVTDVAIDLLRSMKLGQRGDVIDMLNIAYTAAPYKSVKDGDYRLELEDTYLRLDRQIARLIKAIREYAGIGRTLIFLASTGYYDDATPDQPKFRIPTGEFSAKRAQSLLNAMYTAKYGNGDYVAGYYDGHFYLNHKTLDQKNVDVVKAAAEGRDFLSRMSGVAAAYSTADILALAPSDPLRLSTDPQTSGDIYISIQPGWNVTDDTRYPAVTRPVRYGAVSTPAYILAPGVKHQVIDSTVEATELAPTLSRLLRLRVPNGSQSRSLPL